MAHAGLTTPQLKLPPVLPTTELTVLDGPGCVTLDMTAVLQSALIRGVSKAVWSGLPVNNRPTSQPVVPLPEGSQYLGFIFARGDDPAGVEAALRRAYGRLEFIIEPPEGESSLQAGMVHG